METHDKHVEIQCYKRASGLAECVDDTVETLLDYAESGTVDDVSVSTWPDEIRLLENVPGEGIRDHIKEFELWADDHNVSLKPGFTVRDRTTLADDGDRTEPVLVLPVLCLAVRVGGELTDVFPHSADGVTHTVAEAIRQWDTAPRITA